MTASKKLKATNLDVSRHLRIGQIVIEKKEMTQSYVSVISCLEGEIYISDDIAMKRRRSKAFDSPSARRRARSKNLRVKKSK